MAVKALPVKFTPLSSSGSWPVLPKTPVKKSSESTQQVRYLQQGLNALGFVGANGKILTVDGQPGTQTMYAVASCQRAAGITTEPNVVGYWTWVVVDYAMYQGWKPAKKTTNSLCQRCKAIYHGCNRYSGIPVNEQGIVREMQYASDVGLAAQPFWPHVFVAVDRYTSTGAATQTPSQHRFGHARDWMADLDKDGNYSEPTEIAKCQALAEYFAGRMRIGPMQTTIVAVRGDGAQGIDDTSVPLKRMTMRHSGPDRICKIIYRHRIFEWRFVNGAWVLQWWTMKPTSDQHMNHVHTEAAPVIGGILCAGVV